MDYIIQNLGKFILLITIVSISLLALKYRVAIRKFILEVKTELTKVSWSTREELFGSTFVVIGITTLLSVIIGLFDLLLSRAIILIFR